MEFWGYTLLVATQLLLLNRIVLGQFLGSALSPITSHNRLIFFLEENSYFHAPVVSVWQYGLWSFQARGTKLERFLPKNQHTRMKLLNFEKCSGEV